MTLKFLILAFTALLSSLCFSSPSVSLDVFSNFSGIWKITDESLSRKYNNEMWCRPEGDAFQKLFRVRAELHKNNTEFNLIGDISVTLEQLLNVKKDVWLRAFDRAPFAFTTTEREFAIIDEFKFYYSGKVENENKLTNAGLLGDESLTIEVIDGKSYLIYEHDYSKTEPGFTKCTFEKVAY